MPARLKELLHAFHLGGVLLIRAALEAWGETHLHLGINAAGKSGIGTKVVDAAAHFEQIKRVVGELLGGNTRKKRSIVPCFASQPADAGGYRGAGIRIVEDELDQRREAQS